MLLLRVVIAFVLRKFAHTSGAGDLLCAGIKQWRIVIGEQREVDEGERLHHRVVLQVFDLDERRIIIVRIEAWQEGQTSERILILEDPLFDCLAFVRRIIDRTGHRMFGIIRFRLQPIL